MSVFEQALIKAATKDECRKWRDKTREDRRIGRLLRHRKVSHAWILPNGEVAFEVKAPSGYVYGLDNMEKHYDLPDIDEVVE